jgi:hypothetical protein
MPAQLFPLDQITWQDNAHLMTLSMCGQYKKGKTYDTFKMWASQCMTQYQGGNPGDQCGRMQRWMDESSSHVDWTLTFDRPLLLMYEDMITRDHLVCIHNWLRSKCLDIENIIVLNNHHVGISDWWEQWKKLHHEPGFRILEWSFIQGMYTIEKLQWPAFQLPELHWIQEQRAGSISKVFSFFGGRHSAFIDKFYPLLKCLEFGNHAVVDLVTEWPDRSTIMQYLEYVTDYQDQTEVENLLSIYDQHCGPDNVFVNSALEPYLVNYQKPQSLNKVEWTAIGPTFNDIQWAINQNCFVSVIRETLNDQPYDTITEKTFQCMLHYMVPMPLNYGSVNNLERMGFRLPHDLIDYGYSQEPQYRRRVQLVMQQIQQLQQRMTFADMNNYWNTHIDLFHHNAQTVVRLLDCAYKGIFK